MPLPTLARGAGVGDMQPRRFVFGALILIGLSLSAGCGCPCPCPTTPTQQPDTQPPRRPVLPKLPPMGQCVDTPEDVGLEMETVDGMGVVTLSANAFVDLDPEARILAYHLSQAAVAGDAIVYEQRSRFGATIKVVAEELALHLSAIPTGLRPKVETFVRRVFVHKGVHDAWTGAKLSPPFEESELREALLAAVKDGAKLPGVKREADVPKLVNELRPLLFDPDFEPFSRSVEGTPSKIPGPYAEPLKRAVTFLEAAAKHAQGPQRTAIEQLANYLSSGDAAAYERHVRAVADAAPIALRMGTFSTRLSGSELWAGVMLDDASMKPTMTQLAAALPHLRGLVFPASHSAGFIAPRAGIPLTLAGAAAPATPAAETLSTTSGPSQAWVWTPVLDAVVKLRVLAVKKGFVPDPEKAADFERCLPYAYRTRIILRASVGRGRSGPSAIPSADRAVITLAKAELAALVAAADPKVVDMGLLPDAACASVVDQLLPADHLVQLGSVPPGQKLTDPDVRASSLIVRFALAQGALREVTRDGHIHLQVVDSDRWRASVKSLLASLLDIEAKGDSAKARELLRQYADDVVVRWRDSASVRTKAAGLPVHLVYVVPRVKAIRDADGVITDATIVDSLGIIETALVDAGKMEMP